MSDKLGSFVYQGIRYLNWNQYRDSKYWEELQYMVRRTYRNQLTFEVKC